MRFFKTWLSQFKVLRPVEIIVVLLLVVGAFLRLWNVQNAALFLGDQGRDAIVVSRIFIEKDLVFIGPMTSVGNMYLGPLYYYFMLPFLFLSYPSPLGPVYAVAVLGVATIFFLYRWGSKLVGERAAVIAAFLCTFSVVAVDISRFSWNPNPTPFVGLLIVYATFMAIQRHPKFWLLVGVAFAILIQLHYVTLLAGGAAGLLWLWEVVRSLRKKSKFTLQQLVLYAVGAFGICVVSLTPLFIFDLKHDWLNLRAFQSLFSNTDNFSSSATEPSTLWTILRETHGRSMHIFFEFLIGKQRTLNTILLLLFVATVAVFFSKKAFKKDSTAIIVLLVYALVGVLGLSTYRHSVYNHYIAYLFPVTFLLLGYFLDRLWQVGQFGKFIVVVVMLFFLGYNLPRYNFQPAGPSFDLFAAVKSSIYSRVAPQQPYAITLIAETNDYYGMNYRYFLNTNKSKKPLEQSEHEKADLLFIINEKTGLTNPEQSNIYEIKSFPGKRVVERYKIPNGPEITILGKDDSNL